MDNRKMKRNRMIYRISTGIIAIVMTFSIISFTFFDDYVYPEGAFNHLHLPPWFKAELTIAKVLGLLALLLPGIPHKIKEFAYWGFGLTLVSAIIAHASMGDGILYIIDPLLFFVTLIVSYIYYYRIRNYEKPAPPSIEVLAS